MVCTCSGLGSVAEAAASGVRQPLRVPIGWRRPLRNTAQGGSGPASLRTSDREKGPRYEPNSLLRSPAL